MLPVKPAVSAKIGKSVISSSNEEKLLGIKIDTKLSFGNNISSLCKKASQKLHTRARIVNYRGFTQFTSEFN